MKNTNDKKNQVKPATTGNKKPMGENEMKNPKVMNMDAPILGADKGTYSPTSRNPATNQKMNNE